MKLNWIFADSLLQGWLLLSCKIARNENWAWALFSFFVCFCTAVWERKTKVYLHSVVEIFCSEMNACGLHTSGLFDLSNLTQQKYFTFSVPWHTLISWIIFVSLVSPHRYFIRVLEPSCGFLFPCSFSACLKNFVRSTLSYRCLLKRTWWKVVLAPVFK